VPDDLWRISREPDGQVRITRRSGDAVEASREP
jgi:hypothetical protein